MDPELGCCASNMGVQRSYEISLLNLPHSRGHFSFHFIPNIVKLLHLFQERKKIVKGLKGHVSKIAHDRFGSMVRC